VKKKQLEKGLPDSHDTFESAFMAFDAIKPLPLNFVNVQCGSLFSAALTGKRDEIGWK
jgi:hypothetical protein